MKSVLEYLIPWLSSSLGPKTELYIHNIHNWPLQLFSQDYSQASHIYMIMSTPNDRFLKNLFMAILFRETRWRNILFLVSFWRLVWGLNRGLTTNKPTHSLLDYGDCLDATVNQPTSSFTPQVYFLSDFAIELFFFCSSKKTN